MPYGDRVLELLRLSGCQRRKSRLRPLLWNPLNLIGVMPA